MKKKSGHGKGLRAAAWFLSIVLFFSLGLAAGILGERNGLFGGGNSENENTAGAASRTAGSGAAAQTDAGGEQAGGSAEAAGAGTAASDAAGNENPDPSGNGTAGADNAGAGAGDAGNEAGAGTSDTGNNAGAGTSGTGNNAGAGTSDTGNNAGAGAGDAGNDAGTDPTGSGAAAGETGAGTADADSAGTSAGAGAEADVLYAADSIEARAEELLAGMSLEDKVAQLFFVTPDALTGVSGVTRAGDTTRAAFDRRPVGGLILFEENISGPDQLLSFTEGLTEISLDRTGVIPFIATDEEGGTVLRVAKNGSFGLSRTGNMADVGATGNETEANAAGSYIGSYLSQYGLNVDFAPVADVLTNPDNTVVRQRSFGSDGGEAAKMVAACVRGLTGYGVSATLKHFPGHGSTTGDSHKGAAVSYRTMDELRQADLLPFAAGIEAGAEFVMAGHISFPNIDTGEDVPATISRYFLTDILREEMGFDGIIVTDAMNMQAITDYYSSGDAAIKAIEAGADMILMPASFGDAYSAVQTAAADGRISEERIDESVLRILKVKLRKAEAAEP